MARVHQADLGVTSSLLEERKYVKKEEDKTKKTTEKKKREKSQKCKAMQGQKSLPWGEKSTGRRSRKPKVDTVLPMTPNVIVLRVGDAWLVGVGKGAPHGFRCLWLVSPHDSLAKLKAYFLFLT